jgi:hypothetical protein
MKKELKNNRKVKNLKRQSKGELTSSKAERRVMFKEHEKIVKTHLESVH